MPRRKPTQGMRDLRHKRDKSKEAFWRKTLKKWTASGQNVREFCREHDLHEAAFYSWRKTITWRDEEKHSNPFVPIKLASNSKTAKRGSRPDALTARGIEIIMANGAVLRISDHSNVELVARLLLTLEAMYAKSNGRHQDFSLSTTSGHAIEF